MGVGTGRGLGTSGLRSLLSFGADKDHGHDHPGDPLTLSRGEKVMHSLQRADVVSCPTHGGRPMSVFWTVAGILLALPLAAPALGADMAITWNPNASSPGGWGSIDRNLQQTWTWGVSRGSEHLRIDGVALAISRPSLVVGSGFLPHGKLRMDVQSRTFTPDSALWRLPPATPDLSEPPIVMASGGGSGSGYLTSNPGTLSIEPFQLPDALDVWELIDNSEGDPPIVVPIPATAILSGIGLIGVVAIRRRIMARVGQ